jgi:hypothetical protein
MLWMAVMMESMGRRWGEEGGEEGDGGVWGRVVYAFLQYAMLSGTSRLKPKLLDLATVMQPKQQLNLAENIIRKWCTGPGASEKKSQMVRKVQ